MTDSMYDTDSRLDTTSDETMSAMDESGYARVVEKGIRAGIKQAWVNAKR